MTRIRLLALTTIFLVALTALAQQAAEAPSSAEKDHPQHAGAPSAEDHLRMLSEKLGLTAGQQDKLRPILQHMVDERQKLMRDQNLTGEQRDEKQRDIHERADREARKFLNDDQKRKLDDLEAQHHAESPAHSQP